MASDALQPSVGDLLRLKEEIEKSLQSYQAADQSNTKTTSLKRIALASKRLAHAATDPQDAYLDFCFQPLGNACIRVALALNLFEQLSASEGRSSEAIAKRTDTSDPQLVLRLLRTLSALGFVREDGNGGYLQTPLSQIYTKESQRAYAIWMYDVMARAAFSIGDFFDEGHFKANPEYHPINFAFDKEAGKDAFQIVKEKGKSELLVAAMGGSSRLLAQECATIYPFGELSAEEGGVALVDVGGSRGETLVEVRKAHPQLKGRVVLQDLQSVLDGGAIEDLDAEVQPYDFFKESQPVIGAAAYLYQRIFHDWGFEDSRLILQSLKPAMREHSKLLISEIVVEDRLPQQRKTLRDMNMLVIGGMERSEGQWKDLLESEGFHIVQIHGLDNSNHSVIEAAL